jgi:hypothetical protein
VGRSGSRLGGSAKTTYCAVKSPAGGGIVSKILGSICGEIVVAVDVDFWPSGGDFGRVRMGFGRRATAFGRSRASSGRVKRLHLLFASEN